MEIENTSFFQGLDDDLPKKSWNFKNENVDGNFTFKPTKRPHKEVLLKETNISFSDLNLSKPLVKACEEIGFNYPTKIQEETIPIVLKGNDVMICAKTGSGKTGAFSLPIIHRILFRKKRIQATRCLILTPTRELSQQTYSMVQSYIKYTSLTCSVSMGGANSAKEVRQIQNAPDILIGTPGRILDHIKNSKDVSFDYVDFLVLDEADRLLEMGFFPAVKEILSVIPAERQTILASATLGNDIKELAQLALKRPVKVGKAGMPEGLKQVIINMEDDWKRETIVVYLLAYQVKQDVIVFVKTKSDCHKLFLYLKQLNFKVGEIHGGMDQHLRLRSLESFQAGETEILIATDLAARGLDLEIDTVINMHIPDDPKRILHRIGRTARAGKEGLSISLCNKAEKAQLKEEIKHKFVYLSINVERMHKVQAKIDDLEEKVKKMIEKEAIEKEIKEVEIQANRASNIIQHADEIYNRPKKQWIKSVDERREKVIEQKEQKMKGKTKKDRKIEESIMRSKLMVQNYKIAAKGLNKIGKAMEKMAKKKMKRNSKKKQK
ncbi:unnamed protein product [Blepharisma stoltei]|uniref:RNA helicase n=1 Tax=Blepharisma stoltei TaxID=1481888 RepID=A0AAU9KKA0_9CILI|nr:unnamed protein product [Blepharisma stoltei]